MDSVRKSGNVTCAVTGFGFVWFGTWQLQEPTVSFISVRQKALAEEYHTTTSVLSNVSIYLYCFCRF